MFILYDARRPQGPAHGSEASLLRAFLAVALLGIASSAVALPAPGAASKADNAGMPAAPT